MATSSAAIPATSTNTAVAGQAPKTPQPSPSPSTMIFGSDTVTAPSWATTNTPNSSYAVVSSGNASTANAGNVATYNGIQSGITASANLPYDASTGKTWNSATGDYSGPVSPNYKGSSTSGTAGTQGNTPPASGMDGVTVQTNSDGSYTYTATDPTNTGAVAYAQLQNNNLQLKASVQPLLTKVASIANGTYVLSASEQSVLDNIQNQINQSVQTQQQANNMEMGAQSAWSSSVGATRYGGNSSDLFTGDLATREGAKITDIQMKGASALATAKQAILDGDAKALNDAITQYSNFAKENSDNIMNLQKVTNDALTAANAALKAQVDQQNANTAAFKAQQQFNKDNGVTGQFYQYPGSSQVFNSQTGLPVSQQEYLAAGGKADFSSIQVLSNAPVLQGAEGQDYHDYLATLPAGQTAMGFSQFTQWNANLKASAANNADSLSNQTKTYDLRVKQAPSQVAALAAKGYGWDQISSYFQNLGIDPGTPEIDDALHRQFQSQSAYASWKSSNYNTAHGAGPGTSTTTTITKTNG